MKLSIDKNYLKVIAIGILLVAGVAFVSIQSHNPAVNKATSNLPVNLSTYINFSPTTKFLNSNNVLFFKANWCSTCGVADENLASDISAIPENLTIYKVDFDKENQVRAKYGVTVQHTFVQVDNQGNKLKQWVGSYTIDEILQELV